MVGLGEDLLFDNMCRLQPVALTSLSLLSGSRTAFSTFISKSASMLANIFSMKQHISNTLLSRTQTHTHKVAAVVTENLNKLKHRSYD